MKFQLITILLKRLKGIKCMIVGHVRMNVYSDMHSDGASDYDKECKRCGKHLGNYTYWHMTDETTKNY